MKAALFAVCAALAIGIGCGQEPAPTPTSAPTETASPVPPTNTAVAGPVSVSNIPLPTRAPLLTPTPRPTATPMPTPTPLPAEVEALGSARESMAEAGGYRFEVSGSFDVWDGAGEEHRVSVEYAGDALPDYNSAKVSLATESDSVEYAVIALQNMGVLFGEVQRMSYIFDSETGRWAEKEELLALSSLTSPRTLLGSDSYETADIAADGGMQLTGREMLDGVETDVISGKLSGSGISGAVSELEVSYHIGVDDSLLRRVEVSGEFDASLARFLIADAGVDPVRASFVISFSDYGKDVEYATPHLMSPRFSHDAMLLEDGRVLVSGGWTGVANNNEIFPFPAVFSQIYDPETDTWTLADGEGMESSEDLPEFLIYSPATELPDGRIVSVAISEETQSGNPDDVTTAIALFDPEAKAWVPLSDIPSNRVFTDVFALSSGEILVVGGFDLRAMASSFATMDPADIVEAYDTNTGAWRTLEPMNEATMEHSLVSLDDGRVMAVGGFDDSGSMHGTARAEIFDPETDGWTLAASMSVSRMFPEAIALSDGRVLVTGSTVSHSPVPADSPNSEIYDPDTGEWTIIGAMSVNRFGHTLTLLADGRVIAVGGEDPYSDDYLVYTSTEIFDPDSDTWSPGPELSQPRTNHSATLMPDGSVLIAGGISQRGERYPVASTEFVTP